MSQGTSKLWAKFKQLGCEPDLLLFNALVITPLEKIQQEQRYHLDCGRRGRENEASGSDYFLMNRNHCLVDLTILLRKVLVRFCLWKQLVFAREQAST